MSQRIVSLDVLRGVAVLGILLGNMAQYFLPHLLVDIPSSLSGDNQTDLWSWYLIRVMVDGKFLTLFAFLFGISFSILYERMLGRSANNMPMVRRLFALFIVGLLHAILFYYADVLTAYAVAAVLLWPTMRWHPRTQLLLGFALLILIVGPWNYLVSGQEPDAQTLPQAVEDARTAYQSKPPILSGIDERAVAALRETSAFSNGPLSASFEARLARYGDIILVLVFYVVWRSLALFLIGAGLMRSGWLLSQSAGNWVRLALITCVPGIVLSIMAAIGMHSEYLAPQGRTGWLSVAQEVGTLFLAGGIAAIVFWWCSGDLSSLAARGLAAVGRTALSNYIGQSAVMSLLATHVGLGLFGSLSRAETIGLALLFFVIQMALSLAWLSRYKMGPLEWLWRCFTYWHRVPNR